MKKISVIFALIVALSGCSSLVVPASKTVVIPASASPTAVQADSLTKCWEGFMYTWSCATELTIKKVEEINATDKK